MKKSSPKIQMWIVVLIAIFIFAFSFFLKGDMIFSGSFAAIIILIYGIPSIIEKQNDKKSALSPSDAEIAKNQEKLLKYKENFEFQLPVKDNMKDDMKRFYTGFKRYFAILGGIAVIVVPFAVSLHIRTRCGGVLVGSMFIYNGISGIFYFPVRRFFKREKNRIYEIENSYMLGKMVTDNKKALNIGEDYLVAVNDSEGKVKAYSRSEIADIYTLKQRTKNYESGVYMGDTYQFYIVIAVRNPVKKTDAECKIELGEMKMQIAFEELQRQGYIE